MKYHNPVEDEPIGEYEEQEETCGQLIDRLFNPCYTANVI